MQLTSSSAGADHDAIMSSDIQFLDIRAIVLNVFRDILLTLKSIQSNHVTFCDTTTVMKTFCLSKENKPMFKTVVAILMKTGLNNVVRPTLFTVVKTILDNIVTPDSGSTIFNSYSPKAR
jgi:hypothetical protein